MTGGESATESDDSSVDSAVAATGGTGIAAPGDTALGDTGLRRVGIYDPESESAAKLFGEDGDTGSQCYPYNGSCWVHYAGNVGADVTAAGDVNGDGFDDLAILEVAGGGGLGLSGPGAVFVVEGPVAGHFPLSQSQSIVNADHPAHVQGLGDFDGDGYSDIAVSSADDLDGLGGLVEVYSGASLSGIVESDMGAVSIDNIGTNYDAVPGSLPTDLDGDGFSDLLIADAEFDALGRLALAYGSTFTGDVDFLTLGDAISGGVPGEFLGTSSVADDFDGDGLPDIAVSSQLDLLGYSRPGDVMVFPGPLIGLLDRSSAACDLVMDQDYVQASATAPGDLNGDGLHDLTLSSPWYDVSGLAAPGAVFVAYDVIGNCSGVQTVATLLDRLDGNLGDALVAHAPVGDFDRDGYDDLVAGGRYVNGTASLGGTTFLSYGPVLGTRDVGDPLLDAQFDGAMFGGGAGDMNGDGLIDLYLSSPYDDEGGNDAGAVWLLLGGF